MQLAMNMHRDLHPDRVVALSLSALSLLAAIVALPVCPAAAGDAGPRFVGRPPHVRLELPARMRQALERSGAGFKAFMVDEFEPYIWRSELGSGYAFDGKQAPFAVIGDFDGDGRRDAVMRQRSKTEVRTIVVFDRLPAPESIELERFGRRRDATGREWTYLERVPAGRRRVPLFNEAGGDTVLDLAHEAFEIVYFEKGAQMYHYREGRFESIITSD